jgi:diguanylate cyclase (GGDEF)-like protein
MNKSKKIVSIQRQYILIAVLLGGFIIITSAISYSNSLSKTTNLVEKVDKISELLKVTANIRIHYRNAKRLIDDFMLEPELGKHNDSLIADFFQIKAHLYQLKNDGIVKQLPSFILLDEILRKTDTFKKQADKLFDIRIKANAQFPALGISANIMRPARNEIFTVFTVILDEFLENDDLHQDPHVFHDVIQAQKIWISTVSEFRLYLANRLGSFDDKGLIAQEKNIHSYLNKLDKLIDHLLLYRDKNQFGFEGSEILENFPLNIKKWREGLNQVIAINHSTNWRQDSLIMRETILPLINSINLHITEIDEDLNFTNNESLKALKQSGTTLSLVLTSVIALFFLYIAVSIITLKKFIIKPISLIAKALKSEAFGRGTLQTLNIKKSKETQDLIDAFGEMSNQVYKRQKALEHQALSDSLTSLPNRLMLHERLNYHIKIASREKSSLVLMILDLNYFKEVNDTLGHHIGDQLLIQVGERLKSIVRDMDTVARLGGDEFALLLPNTDRDRVIPLAEKINSTIDMPFAVSNHNLQINISIGISEYPADADNGNLLMQYSDIAMYHSKRNKVGYSFYDSSSDFNSVDRLSLSSDLRQAIEEDELELYFQPKYKISTRKIIGAEALLRWQHPTLGFISPEIIVDTAIKMGLINKLSYWVFENAVFECSKCQEASNGFNIAINLAVQNLKDKMLHINIRDILQKHQLSSECISFEVTESAMMTHPEQSIEMLMILNQSGIKLSIDDFGTGFSSLAYLKQLPVEELKIDKSFIINLDSEESDKVIVQSTIQLAHNLGLTVVAEGVENRAVWKSLEEMGCDYAQGYLMSRPLCSDDFKQLLSKHRVFKH